MEQTIEEGKQGRAEDSPGAFPFPRI